MNDTERAALALAAAGRPVVLLAPNSKVPDSRFAPHGVHSATTDADTIMRAFRRVPRLNLGLKCGAPDGASVVDLDDLLAAGDWLPRLDQLGGPCAATPRGRHYYFRGLAQGTIVLDCGGELRGQGSYVVVPPSIVHGKQYVWLTTGPLPPVPDFIDHAGHGAGRGEHQPPHRPIVAGEGRWPYLRDWAVRLVRSGVTDQHRVLEHLRLEFELSCEQQPPPQPRALEALADWAIKTEIAERERGRCAGRPRTLTLGDAGRRRS